MKKKLTTTLTLLLCIAFTNCLFSQEKEKIVEINTEKGTIKVKLYNETPKHRDNFLKLAQEGYFDGTLFHRVIKEFMIQGGDPDSKNAAADVMLGNGGPDYTIPAEINDKFFHKKGALCAARQGDNINPEKASSGSQFYIVQGRKYSASDLASFEQRRNSANTQVAARNFFNKEENKSYQDRLMRLQNEKNDEALKELFAEVQPMIEKEAEKLGIFKYSAEQIEAYSTVGGTPHLDGNYTVFGEVIEGLDVIDKIADMPINSANRPTENISMKVRIVK